MKYEKILLDYKLDDFEPFIEKNIMDYHYNLVYEEATNELNNYVSQFKDFKTKDIVELLYNYKFLPDYLKKPLLTSGSSYLNHSMFFENLSKTKTIITNYDFMQAIRNAFGSFENLKKNLYKSFLNLYGSGFVFLVLDPFLNLEIINNENNLNPLTEHKIPLLCLDCWEHSYYPQYKSKKKYYFENLINLINWKIVENRFKEAKNSYLTNLNIA